MANGGCGEREENNNTFQEQRQTHFPGNLFLIIIIPRDMDYVLLCWHEARLTIEQALNGASNCNRSYLSNR